MANNLIKKILILDQILHSYIKYNSTCKIKQSFNYYKYNYILIYLQKNTNCRAYLSFHKILKYF